MQRYLRTGGNNTMNIIKMGTSYRIFDDSIETKDTLPAAIYTINFNQMEGFSLTQREPMTIEDKIYGAHKIKLEKVIKAYKNPALNRSLGILLTGDKGLGKSFFLRDVADTMVNHGYPVILCDSTYPNLCGFLESIKQECMILFDEYEKHFDKGAQNEMLSLFDGTSSNKKMYCISANSYRSLSDYLIDRPGRFHYHIRFTYPTSEEVEAYMHDTIAKEYHDEIQRVVNYTRVIKLNYDCLRAIAFEINMGIPFTEAITDLNINSMGNADTANQYQMQPLKLVHKNVTHNARYIHNILLSYAQICHETDTVTYNLHDDFKVEYCDEDGNHYYYPDETVLEWKRSDMHYDEHTNSYTIKNVMITYESDEDADDYKIKVPEITLTDTTAKISPSFVGF